MNDEILRIENLHKCYGEGATTVRALDDINVSIERGEFVAIVGPSGCGKSTLLNMAVGIDTPSGGRVVIEGLDLAKMSENQRSDLRLQRIGFVFQNFNLFPTFTAQENVTWPLEFAGVAWRDAKRRSEVALTQLGIVGAAQHRRPAELSGGEQQRVAIARALVTDPHLLVADEPTGNLDSKTGDAILEILQGLNRERKLSIIMVTHSPTAASCSRRAIELRDGKVVAEHIN